MSYLNELEQAFPIRNASVFHEFDNSHFISNAKTLIMEQAMPVPTLERIDYYTNTVQSAIKDFNVISLDSGLAETTGAIARGDTPLPMKLYTKEFRMKELQMKFKPQYLKSFLSMVQDAIDKSIRGDMSSIEVRSFLTADISEKIERQIVSGATISYGCDPSDMAAITTTNIIPVTYQYFQAVIYPFIRSFPQLKEEARMEAGTMVATIQEASNTLRFSMEALNKIRTSGELPEERLQQVNQLSFNLLRNVLEVIGFISFMMIKKLNVISENMISCNKLFLSIQNANPSNILESAFDQNIFSTDTKSLAESLMSGEAGAFGELANHIYEFHTTLPNVEDPESITLANTINEEVDEQSYDASHYQNIREAYQEISTGLDVIDGESENFLAVYDDVLQQAGFGIPLEERYHNVINALNQPEVSSMDSRPLLAELKNMEHNCKLIADDAAIARTKIVEMTKKFENEDASEYKNFETVRELKLYLESMEEQLRTMTEGVASSLFNRIKYIGSRLADLRESRESRREMLPIGKSITETALIIEDGEEEDYISMAYQDIFESMEESYLTHFQLLQESYIKEKMKAKTGIRLVTEAENQPNTTVQVTDNSGTNTNQTSANTLRAKIGDFIKNATQRFQEFLNKRATKNANWISEHQEGLENRSYNNVAVKILPYKNMPPETIIRNIQTTANAVGSLTPQEIQGFADMNAVCQRLFPYASGAINAGGENGLAESILRYCKVGNASYEVVTIANGDLKNEMVQNIIPFCIDMTNPQSQFQTNLNNALTDLGKKSDETIKKANPNPAPATGAAQSTVQSQTTQTPMQQPQPKQESVSIFSEAETSTTNQPAQNSAANINEKLSLIQEAVQKFSGAVMNAIRDRNKDYLSALNSLALKTVTPPQQENTTEQQPEQQTNQTT